MTYTLFLILILIVAILLILIIMVQNPKGGGLSSSFGGGQTMGGVQNTNTFLDKSTWTLAIALFALILLSNFAIPRENTQDNSSQIEETIDNREIQDTPVTIPATQDTTEENN